MLLDHLTRGRIKLGVGPGALATYAFQRGYDPRQLRTRMSQSLDAIIELLCGAGPVNRDSDWFTLRDTSLPASVYAAVVRDRSRSLDLAVWPGAAGRFGCSLLSIGSTLVEEGVAALGAHWGVFEEPRSPTATFLTGLVAGRRSLAHRADARSGICGDRVRDEGMDRL